MPCPMHLLLRYMTQLPVTGWSCMYHAVIASICGDSSAKYCDIRCMRTVRFLFLLFVRQTHPMPGKLSW